jgi:purine nucleoside phosphorylase
MTRVPLVLVKTRDLFFRAKVEDHVRRGGGTPTRSEPYDAVVVELGSMTADEVRQLTAAGTAVLVFGPHVEGTALRELRSAGATSVPNSRLPEAVVELLGYLSPRSGKTGDA